MHWNDKPYHSLDYELKHVFGKKMYKVALDGGMTCPNRDGTIARGGCIFCSEGGSGDFAEKIGGHASVADQIKAAKERVGKKLPEEARADSSGRYIAYFQSYTNTYAPAAYLEGLFMEAIEHPDIAVLSVATRPDCLGDDILKLLGRLNRIKPVWVELGLQTIHEKTAAFIRRGYPLSVFDNAWYGLKKQGITVVAHVIMGLPGETEEMMYDTVRYLGKTGGTGIDGIKLQLLHVLKGTDLGKIYEASPFPVLSLDEYADLIVSSAALLPERTVIHRITGDGPKSLLLAPAWSANKRLVLNTISKRFRERKITQGDWTS